MNIRCRKTTTKVEHANYISWVLCHRPTRPPKWGWQWRSRPGSPGRSLRRTPICADKETSASTGDDYSPAAGRLSCSCPRRLLRVSADRRHATVISTIAKHQRQEMFNSWSNDSNQCNGLGSKWEQRFDQEICLHNCPKYTLICVGYHYVQ